MATKKQKLKGIGLTKDEIRNLISDIILTFKERFILLTSGRNVGKTYTTQKTVIQYCIDNDVVFGFAVPTITEMNRGMLKEWVSKCVKQQFKKYQFRYTRERMFYRASEEEDYVEIGRCFALSEGENNKKRASPLMEFLIFDEAVVSNTTAMEEALYSMQLLYETLDRNEDKIKAIFLCNTLSKVNPFYNYFEVTTKDLAKQGTEIRTQNRYCWYIPNPIDLDEGSEFKKMIKGTSYGNMSSGMFDENYGFFVEEPPKKSKFYSAFGIELGEGTFCSVMHCENDNFYCEVCTEAHLKKFADPIFNTIFKKATTERPMLPDYIRNAIYERLEVGKFKFLNEESLLVLSTKFAQYLSLRIM